MMRLWFLLFLASGFTYAKKQISDHCQCEIENTELHQQVFDAMQTYKETVPDGDFILAIASRNGYVTFLQDHRSSRYTEFGMGDLYAMERFWSYQYPLSKKMIFNFPELIGWLSYITGQTVVETKKLFNVKKYPSRNFSMNAYKWVALMVPAKDDLAVVGKYHPLSTFILEEIRKQGWYQWLAGIDPTVEWCMEERGGFKVYYTFPIGVSIDTGGKSVSTSKSPLKVFYKAASDELVITE
ncbi:hypothetical protein [Spongorhabdus nitratireducens]